MSLPVECKCAGKRARWVHAACAGDGLQAEGPLRRSTRLSVKPLDWWRNEKVVYERKYKSESVPSASALSTGPPLKAAPCKVAKLEGRSG